MSSSRIGFGDADGVFPDERWRCPTCRAPWHEGQRCHRCGTELGDWLRALARAQALRESARAAFFRGAYEDALQAAAGAWKVQRTERGRRLLLLSLLASGRGHLLCWRDGMLELRVEG